MSEKEIREEILHALHILPENDRDLRTIMIWLNPNHVRGTDIKLKPKFLKVLNQLEKDHIIHKYQKKIRIYKHASKIYDLYSLTKGGVL